MSNKTRVDMIIETLRDHKGEKLTARELAKLFLDRYPAEMAEKMKNPNYANDEELIAQLAAEVGGQRTRRAKEKCINIKTREKPRPRLYYWDDNPDVESKNEVDDELHEAEELKLKEHDLYPILIEFLNKDMGLYCHRIDEKTSKNSQGAGGNHWLHPDIVAMEPLDKSWSQAVKTCVRFGNDKSVRLWSFEVKKELTRANVRKCFFQAVSNSSWANFGYLVATGISDGVEPELQMLCSLHGIGILLLDVGDLYNSQILIPAKEKSDIDWVSANRIVEENPDFMNYIKQVGIYHQTGELIPSVWNR